MIEHQADDEREVHVFSDEDRAILEFERSRWKFTGAKESEIRCRFAMSATRYYLRLRWVLAQPEALAYDAPTVRRLQRLAHRRAAVRTVGTAAAGVETAPDIRGIRPRLM